MFNERKNSADQETLISEVKKDSNPIIAPFTISALNANVITERASANLDKTGQSSALIKPSPAVAITATTRLWA
jgi:hypothetical protein